jgi:hypothetical protein
MFFYMDSTWVSEIVQLLWLLPRCRHYLCSKSPTTSYCKFPGASPCISRNSFTFGPMSNQRNKDESIGWQNLDRRKLEKGLRQPCSVNSHEHGWQWPFSELTRWLRPWIPVLFSVRVTGPRRPVRVPPPGAIQDPRVLYACSPTNAIYWMKN